MQNNLPPLCDAERRFLCAQRPPARGYRFPGSGGSDALSGLSGGIPPSGFSGGVPPVMVMEPLESKPALQQYLFEQHACPEFENVDHISREDGCKVYFTDGSWGICRFSGTEPLLRMAAEAETDEKPSPISRPRKPSCRSERSA